MERANFVVPTGDTESSVATLHAITPYIGKLSPSIAKALILEFSRLGQTVLDPFCGSGTVPLEAAALGRIAIGGDLSPYAEAATLGKLFPYANVETALSELSKIAVLAEKLRPSIDLRSVPHWVREFYHPETLREAISWSRVLKRRKNHFLMACFLNILHHQRQGFLSYPAAHAVPYLRVKKFPSAQFPEMYERRDVLSRMIKKILRTIDISASVVSQSSRRFQRINAARLCSTQNADLVLSSPPYMSELDYGRDNRLRLWFLGCEDWQSLDSNVSPTQSDFLALIENCAKGWTKTLTRGGHIVLIVGDPSRTGTRVKLAALLRKMFSKYAETFKEISIDATTIPNSRRVRRELRGTTTESVLVYQKR